jgi:hypothetical protein
MSNTVLQAVLWIAAALVLVLYVARRRKRRSIR